MIAKNCQEKQAQKVMTISKKQTQVDFTEEINDDIQARQGANLLLYKLALP